MADLDANRLAQLLQGRRWGHSLDVRTTTESTMDDAARAAARDAPDGHVVFADRQTQGRGAHGRTWVSPPGTDLYFSIVARPNVEPGSTAMITLAVGLGVQEAIAGLVPETREVRVKWPNDLWIDGRKCAGILVESRTLGTKIDSVIIGIGVNVNRRDWPAELENTATSIAIARGSDAPVDRELVFANVLGATETWVDRLVSHGGAPIVHALASKLALVGERVQWEEGAGILEGIDASGAAQVRTDEGLITVHAARFEPDG